MKFLNTIDGASKLLTDSNNRLVSDSEKSDIAHSNRVVLDKFSETDGALKYNGEDIGGTVPNLTLTELTLGNYKMRYNSSSNKLELVYIGS